MNRETLPSLNSADAAEHQLVIDWLGQIGQRRDLGLAAPSGAWATAIVPLLDALSSEFFDYGQVVAGARAAACRNAEQIEAVAAATGEHGIWLGETAASAVQAQDGAARTAEAAAALRGFAGSAAEAAGAAGDNLGSIGPALRELIERMTEQLPPLTNMRQATGAVAGFVVNLSRLSSQAQLLGVNASIEAAHLGEAGSRFEIVAQEVRKLSTSTRESKTDVARIVAELRASTEHVARAVRDSQDATAAAGAELAGAAEALGRTRAGIGEFEALVATVADVAANQSIALAAVRASVDEISRHADEAAGASREAARLDLDALLERARTRADRWTLRQTAPPAARGNDEFSGWILALADGADAKANAAIDADDRLRGLVTAVRTLLEQVDSDQREILAGVIEAAVAIARNGYAWRSIAESTAGLGDAIERMRATVGESARSAHRSAELATGMRRLVDAIRLRYFACDMM